MDAPQEIKAEAPAKIQKEKSTANKLQRKPSSRLVASLESSGKDATQGEIITILMAPRQPRRSKSRTLPVRLGYETRFISVGDQIAEADTHAQNKNYRKALENYQRVVFLAPQSFETIYSYHQSARLYTEWGNSKKALKLYEIIISRHPDYRYLNQVYFESGKLYIKEKEFKKSFDRLQPLYDNVPEMRTAVMPHLEYVRRQLKAQLEKNKTPEN